MSSASEFVGDDVAKRVRSMLSRVERDYGVRIIFACESGSRAWGFYSSDSDYDVRFVYVYERDWYLGLAEERDVIELPDDPPYDVNGWDLRKALRLMRKGNPPLLEWMHSPIQYTEHEPCMEILRRAAEECFRPEAAAHHYYHMAKGNFREYLRADMVPLKKYLYVLRPLVAIRHVDQFGDFPLVSFEELLGRVAIDAGIREEILKLIEAKKESSELGIGPKNPKLNAFIEEELSRDPSADEDGVKSVDHLSELNEVFLEILAAHEQSE